MREGIFLWNDKSVDVFLGLITFLSSTPTPVLNTTWTILEMESLPAAVAKATRPSASTHKFRSYLFIPLYTWSLSLKYLAQARPGEKCYNGEMHEQAADR